MAQTLYVSNIAYTTTEEDLKAHFAQAGQVASAKIITDRFTGRSRGFGFVDMASEEDAQNAIRMFDGQEFGGRQIKVNIAKPQEDRPRRSSGGFGGGQRSNGGYDR